MERRACTSAEGEPVLELEGIVAGYGNKNVLRELSISVRQSEIVAIIGANGAGKSTVLKTIAGVIAPSKGVIRVRGKDITAFATHKVVARGIGYLMQGGQVFGSMSVSSNIDVGVQMLPRDKRQHAIQAVLEVFPILRKHWHRRAGLLSGGERQSLAIGMVIAQSPTMLLLDEPAADLAPNVAHQILSSIRDLNQRLGTTVVLVEQRIREALELSHRAVFLRNGSIAAQTSEPSLWLADGALDELYLARF